MAGACGDSDPVFSESADTTAAPAATVVEVSPFDSVVELVLTLPADELFVLLDGLSDDDYFALESGRFSWFDGGSPNDPNRSNGLPAIVKPICIAAQPRSCSPVTPYSTSES